MLLQHESGALLVASRRGTLAAFQCQRHTRLNKDSWVRCGIATKTKKNFAEPKRGYVVGQRLLFDDVPYLVVGFNSDGWLSAWDAIVLAAK